MNGTALSILIEATRAVSRSLRGLADTLDLAAARAEGSRPPPAPTPALSSDTVDTVDWDLITQLDSITAPSAGPRPSAAPGLPGPEYSGYHEVARALLPLPEHCLDLCRRLAGSPTEVRARAQRAWDAGQWAKATLENKVAKPRPTPKLALQATCYIILRGPGIERPVRVASSAEYFKLLPTFEGSVSHSFPSLAEGRVYCLAAGVAFPDPADQ